MEAIDPPLSNKGEETIYEAWGKCVCMCACVCFMYSYVGACVLSSKMA